MTALIYKPTFPIPTQGDAGEVLTLNEAGTAYELEPAQSGASVADSFLHLRPVAGQTGIADGNQAYVQWSVQDDGGTDLELDADDEHVNILTDGITVAITAVVAVSGAGVVVIDGGPEGLADFDSYPQTAVAVKSGGGRVVVSVVARCALGEQLNVSAYAEGGAWAVGDESRLSVRRIA